VPLRVGGEDGRVVVVGVRSLVDGALGLHIGIASGLSRVGVLGRFLCLRLNTGFARAGILSAVLCLVTRVIGAWLLSLASGVLRLCIGLGGSLSRIGVPGRLVRLLLVADLARVVGIRGLLRGVLRIGLGGSLSRAGVLGRFVSSRFLGLISRLRAALIGRLVNDGVLDVRVLRSLALSLGILSALGVLGRLVRLLGVTSLARVGASDAFDLIAVNRPGLIGRLVLVHRRAAVSGRLLRLGRLRLRRVPLTESRVRSGLAGRTISRSPCVTHATSSTGGRRLRRAGAP